MPRTLRPPLVGDSDAGVTALLGQGSLGRAMVAASGTARAILDETVAGGRPAPARVEELVCSLAGEAETDAEEAGPLLYLAALRDPRLHSLPPAVAIAAIVDLFCALAPARDASLWWRSPDGRLTHVTGSGEAAATRAFRGAATVAIAGAAASASSRRSVHAVPVSARPAALSYRCPPRLLERCRAFALEAAASLDVLFLIEDLLSRSADRERSLVESSERRLVRVGFDLHDGPMQDIAALAQDVRLFRAQLATILEGDEHQQIALGRVADLEARLLELDRSLR